MGERDENADPEAEAAERAVAGDALREREAELRAIFEGALDAMIIADDDGRFVAANPAACELFGTTLEGLRGKAVVDFAALPLDVPELWSAFLDRGSMEGVFEVARGDGRRRITDFRAKAHVAPGRHLSVLRDVTDRHRLEAQVRHAQKMEGIGRLAGGIAHDFNNVLAAILIVAHGVMEALGDADPLRGELQEIVDTASRGTLLTRQLLALGRSQVLAPTALDLHELVRSTSAMLRRLIPESIELDLSLAREPLCAMIDPSQFEQVILNLAVNARDAMPEGGTLTIATSPVTLDAGEADLRGLQPGRYVRLRVSDTGIGMDAETMAHVFEPFFTTKPAGRGTGLGLSTVYGIVTQSGGHVEVESTPSEGSTFVITLPRLEEGATVEVRSEAPPAEGAPGNETIIVVEDEEPIRQALARMLTRAGYQVLQAANAGEALLLSEDREAPIQLLLTDVVMPRVSGPRLAERLARNHPEMKVLFMTGHPRDELTGLRDHRVLQKPFSPEKLLDAVRACFRAP